MQALQVYDDLPVNKDHLRFIYGKLEVWSIWYQYVDNKHYYYLCDMGIVNAVMSSQELAMMLWDSIVN